MKTCHQGIGRMLGCLAASTLAVLFLTAPAAAQFGNQAGFAEAFQKDFLRRDMQLFVDYLRLEDWQRPIIEVLLDDYQIDFDEGTESCKDQMAGLKDAMLADPERAMEIALQPIKDWEIRKKQMRTDFMDNIRAQLSPLQLQRWESLERAMRREKELPLGELPGEKMNIFAVLHGMELRPGDIQTIDPALMTYEIELDAALDQRRQQMNSHQPSLQDAMVSKDYEQGIVGLSQIAKARNNVIETHLRAIEQIHQQLDQPLADEFRLKILRRGYPEIFKKTIVDTLIENLREGNELTSVQSSRLDDIEAEYRVSIVESNENLLNAYRAYGDQIPVVQARQSIARRNKEPVNRSENMPQQILDATKSRSDMIQEYRNRILELLTPEQISRLPASAKFDRRGRDGGADGARNEERTPRRQNFQGNNRQPFHPDKNPLKEKNNITGGVGNSNGKPGSGKPQSR